MTGRAKGFAVWKPQKKTEGLLADIEQVLEEYRSYLPMTVRQVFYRLVGLGYPKREGFYDKVQDACNRGRRAGRISFTTIRDDGVSRQAEKRFAMRVPRITTRARRSFTITTGVAGTLTNQPPSLSCVKLQVWSRC